jgi:O-antigen/teichoic acid export membrane protein
MVGRTGWDLVVYAASVAFDIGSAILLIGGFGLGMEGAALAGALTMALSKLARLFLVWRFVGIQPYDRDYLRLAAPAGTALLAAIGTARALSGAEWPVTLVVTAVVGTAVYVVVLLAAGLAPAERSAIRRMVGSVRRSS